MLFAAALFVFAFVFLFVLLSVFLFVFVFVWSLCFLTVVPVSSTIHMSSTPLLALTMPCAHLKTRCQALHQPT